MEFRAILFLFIYLLICSACQPRQEGAEDRVKKIGKNNLGLAFEKQNRLKEALGKERLDSVIAGYVEIGELYADAQMWDSLIRVGYSIFNLDYSYSIKDYQLINEGLKKMLVLIPEQEDTSRAKIREILGYTENADNNLNEALAHYQYCVKAWEKHPPRKQLRRSYNMLCQLYTKLGDYPYAEKFCLEGKRLNSLSNDTIEGSNNCFNLGRVYTSQGKWKLAIDSYQKGQTLYPYLDGYYEASLASAYLAGAQVQEAENLAKRALALTLQKPEESSLGLAHAYRLMADIYRDLKKFTTARDYYQKSLDAFLGMRPKNPRETGKAYVFLGDIYKEQGLWNLALETYQQAIHTFIPSFQPGPVSAIPNETHLSREVWLMEALRSKGTVFLEKYSTTQNPEFLTIAARHFNAAVGFIHKIKLLYTEQEAKVFLGDYSIPFIEDAIHTYLELYNRTGKAEYQDTAFQMAQQASAFVLREEVNEQQALQIGQVPADTVDQLRKLQEAIINDQVALNITSELGKADSLQEKIFLLKRGQERFLNRLKRQYPTYSKLKYELSPHPVKAIQTNLDAGTLTIKYFLGERTLTAFAISNTVFKTFQFDLDSSFYLHLEAYRKSLSDLDYIRQHPKESESEFLSSAFFLYQILLEPILEEVENLNGFNRLIIIPDGVLNHIVFDCLLTRPADSWLNREAFLVNQFAISYAYYSGLLANEIQGPKPKSKFLGFGIQYDNATLDRLQILMQDSVKNQQVNEVMRGKKLTKLKFADKEVLEINNLVSGKVVLNKKATKQKFLRFSPFYEVIHLAAHGMVDMENNDGSSIIFNKSKEDSSFLLSIPEIYSLPLNAQLVTLSACQTGTGPLTRSEGLISIARAFQFAGCPSTLASQWSVSDQTSSLIMKEFYKNLNKGKTKDESLRLAKLAYLSRDELSSPSYRIPAYWAPVILIGERQGLEFESVRTFSFLWVIAGILFLGMVIFWIKRKGLFRVPH